VIIWGSKGRGKTIATGEFYCPQCEVRRVYHYKEMGKYFTLYFIPIVKTRDLGEYVECQTCKTTFKPEVLQASRHLEEEQRTVDQIASIVEAARKELDKGIALDALMAALKGRGLDQESAIRLVTMAAGPSLAKCSACELVYRSTLLYCSKCGSRLDATSI